MKINRLVLNAILDNLPMSLRKWSELMNIGVATLSGWKNGEHLPREDSLDILIKSLANNLDAEEKEKQYLAITESVGIDVRSPLGQKIRERFKKSPESFWKYMLIQYDSEDSYYSDFFSVDSRLLNKIIVIKLKRWLNYTRNIFCRYIELGSRESFAFEIIMQSEEADSISVVFSYVYALEDIGEIEKKLREKGFQKKEKVICQVFFTIKEVSDEEYERILSVYGVYLKRISRNDLKERVVNDGFVSLSSETDANTLQKLNLVADVLYRQIVDSFYLVYKEVVCCQYSYTNINESFFQSNAGIGEYPYAVRRAISFEKNLIESVLKKKTDNGKKKMDLLIDLNCLGGIYGVRLNQYASAVICADTSKRAIETLQETVNQYNRRKSSQNPGIVNIETELMREDTYEILGSRNLREKVDCIILGLGSFSHVKNPDLFMKKIGYWLKKDGHILISSYNADALSILLKRYDNLNYWYDSYNHRFIYNKGQIELPMPMKLYTFRELRQIISKYFEVQEDTFRSYPVISSVFSSEPYQRGMDIIKEVDKASASYSHQQLAYGDYNMIGAVKYPSRELNEGCLEESRAQLKAGIEYKTIHHAAFVSSDTMVKCLANKGIYIEDNFIKTVIIKDDIDRSQIHYLFVVLPWHKKVNLIMLQEYYREREYKYNKNRVSLCTEKDLRKIGFNVGSISPFSYSILKRSLDIKLIFDRCIRDISEEIIYTYTGQCSSTYKIRKKDFIQYLELEGAIEYELSV